jgi:GNAT superfamily N-acetyltransferase
VINEPYGGVKIGPIVREAHKSDTPIIAKNNIQLALETEGMHLEERAAIKGVETVLSNSDRGFYLIVEDNGQMIGQCLITREWSDWRNGYFWWVQSVYVGKDWRGKGTFSSIFEKIHSMARERIDVVGLRLYVNRENALAREVYQRLGMKESRYVMYEKDLSDPESD